jgi:hypothetical protein
MGNPEEEQIDDQFTTGYWWAISLVGYDDPDEEEEDDAEPEVVRVDTLIPGFGPGRTVVRFGDGFPHSSLLFVPLRLIDTSQWPSERKLTKDEYLDEKRVVDPDTVEEGYWWAFHFLEDEPEIIRIRLDEDGRKGAYRAGADEAEDLASFEFMMKIDTSQWPRE